MRRSMPHNDRVEILRSIGVLWMKNTGDFLDFELDESNDVMVEDNYLNFYIPVNFDVDKMFGLDVCSTDNDDYINLYINWYPYLDKDPQDRIEVFVVYCNNSTDSGDFELKVVLRDCQKKLIARKLNKECKKLYGMTLKKYWATYGASVPV